MWTKNVKGYVYNASIKFNCFRYEQNKLTNLSKTTNIKRTTYPSKLFLATAKEASANKINTLIVPVIDALIDTN